MNHEREAAVIRLEDDLEPIGNMLDGSENLLKEVACGHNELGDEVSDLAGRINRLAEEMGVALDPLPEVTSIEAELSIINKELKRFVPEPTAAKTAPFPPLSAEEVIFSSIAGLISVAIDVIFVGTPEIVRVYKGGETFDGSILTDLIRKIGDGPNGEGWPVLQWLSDHCKVPYDTSAKKGILIPNNHRLRSLGHDPFFGLFFAVADIIMGTTTCIDNDGNLRILISPHPAPMYEKILSVFFYIGHIFSDICTARGIPIPGFFLTQFFTNGGSDNSLARIAERMYQDGYDMRHLISMSVPVYVKNLIIDSYLSLRNQAENQIAPIAQKEYAELAKRVKHERMILLSDAVAVGGNAVKFFVPPNCGNPCALNAAQWFSLVRNSIHVIQIETTNRDAETLIVRRQEINRKWKQLLN